jgi:hypothetical protein
MDRFELAQLNVGRMLAPVVDAEFCWPEIAASCANYAPGCQSGSGTPRSWFS